MISKHALMVSKVRLECKGLASKISKLGLTIHKIGHTNMTKKILAQPTKLEFLGTAYISENFLIEPTCFQNFNLSLASSLHSSFIKVHLYVMHSLARMNHTPKLYGVKLPSSQSSLTCTYRISSYSFRP